MAAYLVSSAAFLLVMGIIWSKSGLGNICIKLVCVGLGIYGLILALAHFGYVVRH